jgi:hypothetical protein
MPDDFFDDIFAAFALPDISFAAIDIHAIFDFRFSFQLSILH